MPYNNASNLTTTARHNAILTPLRIVRRLLFAVLATAMLLACTSGNAPIVGVAGEPRVHAEQQWPLNTPAEYREVAEVLRERHGFVGLDPDAYPEFTRFGILARGLAAFGSVAVRAVEDGGFKMRADLDDDGRLDDGDPLRFHEAGEHPDGRRFVSDRELAVTMIAPDRPVNGRLTLDLIVTSDGIPYYVLETAERRREGTLRLSDRSLTFAINTTRRAHQFAEVCFDLDEDGQMSGLECFDYRLRRVELLGQKYQIEVAGNSDRLTLTPVDAEIVPRITGTIGEVVPDFAFEDSGGEAGNLSDFRGRVVLLDFWATWCGPCVADTPTLLELHERFADDGLTILAIDVQDEPQVLDTYVREHQLPWRQIREDFYDPIQTLFGVQAFPTYVLIDREGGLLTMSQEADPIAEAVSAAFSDHRLDN